jgi:hypothetical protein
MNAHRLTRRLMIASLVAVPMGVSAYMNLSPIEEVRWLAGCWEGRSERARSEELWMEPRGGTMLGMSRTTRGDSTVGYELMRISEQGERLVFTAHPSGQPAAAFSSAAISATEVVFTNPEHDFPQSIRYRRAGSDSLVARVEGFNAGHPQAIDFPMARVACPGGAAGSGSPEAAAPSATRAQIFSPGVISDARWQYRITFTPDRRTAYYTAADSFFPRARRSTILVSHLRGGVWTSPQTAPFSGTYTDIDPFITQDERRLYFASIRPVDGVPRTDLDIWMMERTRTGWSEPVHLGTEVNSPADELYASAAADGTLYFASGPAGPAPTADWNIFRAERSGEGFSPREMLSGAINTDAAYDPANPTADWEFNPEISADGRTLIFTSLRPGGHGYGDLYISHLRGGDWTPARNLGPPVNTADDEFHPTISRDGRHLYFARTIFSPTLRASDFYVVPVSALNIQ